MFFGIDRTARTKETLVSDMGPCIESWQQDGIGSVSIQGAIGLIGELRPRQDLPALQHDVTERKQFVVHIICGGCGPCPLYS